ncbi:hypothetical protein KEJ21_04255 [Candidatus Bathyarchaeota archaeon]|nr:hypothetical protein [Candidatus Bathyarchaeota archaeon]MBS7630316.1 hypothetical protein [Candidatus Bathyarchaeota archaeon]
MILKKERLEEIDRAFKLAIEKKEDYVIVREIESGKFIQFAIFESGGIIVMDIPLIELSSLEIEDLISIFDASVAWDRQSNEYVSIQKFFDVKEVDKISNIIEKIFTEVFNFPENYRISIEVFSK